LPDPDSTPPHGVFRHAFSKNRPILPRGDAYDDTRSPQVKVAYRHRSGGEIMATSKTANETIFAYVSKKLLDLFHSYLLINASDAAIFPDIHVAPLRADGSGDEKMPDQDKTDCTRRIVYAEERERTFFIASARNRSEQFAAQIDSDGLFTESDNRKESRAVEPKSSTPAKTRHRLYPLTAHARDELPVRIAYARDRPSRISDLTPV